MVLLIGRLVYEKGFQIALEAMPALIERVPGTRFLVAGSGTHEDELLKQASELGLMEHGTFLGWIGDDVLHSLYRIADVCVVPSIYEPFGLVALEAMASGCPCIVADTGGLREVVPDDRVGLRFRSRDPQALAAVAARVLTDGTLRERPDRRGARARSRVRLARRRRPDRRRLRVPAGRARPGLAGTWRAVAPGLDRVGPAQPLGRLAHPDHPRRDSGGDGVGGDVAGDDGVGADDGVVADGHAAEDLGAVADPDVAADDDVARVDPLDRGSRARRR